ncbi:hypothetical protein D1818_04730 [Aquimarina sp. BL5]|uniref:hypothetical protein n=1 Tax=Aquimarina sp. BL5 TaxID=1714860 RepID=UPI000E489B18|nr:hypothetical protein [Aquimarina sp. BL5]AXT50169.1 hypothetical protein D1818_04730 [Aquimarina sp. BL5]RKM96350.1 hypothetical protein D7036_20905 [Aquimarina sp. BL5]
MKKSDKGKLSLDKTKIAGLNNMRAVVGGSLSGIEPDIVDLPSINVLTFTDQNTTSTKTLPVGSGMIDPNDL